MKIVWLFFFFIIGLSLCTMSLNDNIADVIFNTRDIYIDEQTQLTTVHEKIQQLSREINILQSTQDKLTTAFILACTIAFFSISTVTISFSVISFVLFRTYGVRSELHENDEFRNKDTTSLLHDQEIEDDDLLQSNKIITIPVMYLNDFPIENKI